MQAFGWCGKGTNATCSAGQAVGRARTRCHSTACDFSLRTQGCLPALPSFPLLHPPACLLFLQTALAKPIIQLLAKEHHTRQAVALRPTVGQTLLEGISQSQPQPKIPAEMIKCMGRHVHAWHIAVSMLEGHVVLFPTDMRCFDALCHLYRSLAEEDMAFGLWHRRAIADDTRVALALRQHGFLKQAQLQFLELMGRGVSGGIQGEQHKRGRGAELRAGGVAGRARHAAAPHHTTTPHHPPPHHTLPTLSPPIHHQRKQQHGSKGSEPRSCSAPPPLQV